MSESARRYLKNKRIGIIGAGNMGEALIKSFRGKGSGLRVKIFDINPMQREYIKNHYKVCVSKNISDLMQAANVVILAIKPQDMEDVLKEIVASHQLPVTSLLFISIAAGITTRYIENRLGKARVMRVMPNMAAKVGESISAIARGAYALKQDIKIAKAIFESVGGTVEIKENLMDIVTAISGSGPAYFFYVARALIEAGCKFGLASDTAALLASRTLLGAGRLLADLNETPEALISRVASKGGTTEAALKVFEKKGLNDIIISAVKAAAKRSKELSK